MGKRANRYNVVQLVHESGKVDVVRVEREINEGGGVHAMGRDTPWSKRKLAINLPFVEQPRNKPIADLALSRRVCRFIVIAVNVVSKVSIMDQGEDHGIVDADLVHDCDEIVVSYGLGFVGKWILCRVI